MIQSVLPDSVSFNLYSLLKSMLHVYTYTVMLILNLIPIIQKVPQDMHFKIASETQNNISRVMGWILLSRSQGRHTYNDNNTELSLLGSQLFSKRSQSACAMFSIS